MVADSSLDSDIELLTRDQLFHLLNQFAAAIRRIIVMRDQRQRIHALAVNQHIHAHHIGGLEAFEVVVQRGIAAGSRLQTVKEVEHHFRHRNFIGQRNLIAVIDHIGLYAAFFDTQGNDVA